MFKKFTYKISLVGFALSLGLSAPRSEALIVGLSTGGTGLIIAGGSTMAGSALWGLHTGDLSFMSESAVHDFNALWSILAVIGLVLDNDKIEVSGDKMATLESQFEKNGMFKVRGSKEKLMKEFRHFSDAVDSFEKGQMTMCVRLQGGDNCSPDPFTTKLENFKGLSQTEQVTLLQKQVKAHYGFEPSSRVMSALLSLQTSLLD